MAPSCKDAQPDLFDALDGKSPVGVFYFPKTTLSQADQLGSIEATIRHLQTLTGVLEKHKITAWAAPRFSPLVKWLATFESRLRDEKEKLLQLNPSTPQSTQESTEPAPAEQLVTNHAG